MKAEYGSRLFFLLGNVTGSRFLKGVFIKCSKDLYSFFKSMLKGRVYDKTKGGSRVSLNVGYSPSFRVYATSFINLYLYTPNKNDEYLLRTGFALYFNAFVPWEVSEENLYKHKLPFLVSIEVDLDTLGVYLVKKTDTSTEVMGLDCPDFVRTFIRNKVINKSVLYRELDFDSIEFPFMLEKMISDEHSKDFVRILVSRIFKDTLAVGKVMKKRVPMDFTKEVLPVVDGQVK